MLRLFDPSAAEHEPGTHAPRLERGAIPGSRLARKSWKEQAQELGREVQIIWLIFRDPRTPWYARLVAACAAGYVFSPIQLIPSFIPVIGFLDDFLVLSVGFKMARWLAPTAVIRDCKERAAGAENQPDREMRLLATPATALVAGAWLLAAIAATVWFYR